MKMTQYQEMIHTTRYARWLPEEKRRETWAETVDRYVDFMTNKVLTTGVDPTSLSKSMLKIRNAIYNMEIMPSMRALMTAGPALERDNIAGYNCAYLPIDHVRCLPEVLHILMCGTGVGYSVERQYIQKLPTVPEELEDVENTLVVADSKEGWSKAFRALLYSLYNGEVPRWDLGKIRPAGARLKTFGGRASGPGPLDSLFKYTVETFKLAKGRKLTSLECHDLVCKVADVVVVGGVRRSALISLSNLTDERMRRAKTGDWYRMYPHRSYANNSVCYTERPDVGVFLTEMENLYASKSGERGIFSRPAAKAAAARSGRRDSGFDFGTNPCSEIILRPRQFCNLTEVVIRAGDTEETLAAKVRLATILGTLQSTLTDFKFIHKDWQKNCEEERLLGVSLTGLMDCQMMYKVGAPKILGRLKDVAVRTNATWAKALNINPSTAITCVKPSGTVSQLVDSSSGIHARFAPYYIRRVRNDKKDPVSQLLIDQGFPYEEDKYQSEQYVFSFPQKSPDGALCVDRWSALEQLDYWKMVADAWCEHKPSCTVYYKNGEFLDIVAWCYRNFDILSGISFLPKDEHSYEQAPYEEITEKEYLNLSKKIPTIDWAGLVETEDNTTSSQEMACVGTSCEL